MWFGKSGKVILFMVILLVSPAKAQLWRRLLNPGTFCDTTPGAAMSMFGFCQRSNYAGARQQLAVFGAGLPRTGTDSLRVALQNLGYKTYHMKSYLAEPQHLHGWEKLLQGGNSSAVFEGLQRDGYNATLDVPMCGLLSDALERNPATKVILTVRDNAEKWLGSWKTLANAAGHAGIEGGAIDRMVPGVHTMRESVLYSVSRALDLEHGECVEEYLPHLGQPQPVNDTKCLEAYERYIEKVKRMVPPEQLLVFNVKEGYEPLCEFLGVPAEHCPETFPHVNSKLEMALAGGLLAFVRFFWWLPTWVLVYASQKSFSSSKRSRSLAC